MTRKALKVYVSSTNRTQMEHRRVVLRAFIRFDQFSASLCRAMMALLVECLAQEHSPSLVAQDDEDRERAFWKRVQQKGKLKI